MAHIKIEQLEDYNYCETCGGGDSGGRIWIDGKLIWEKIPSASCYDGTYMSDASYYRIALDYLGHTVEDDNG